MNPSPRRTVGKRTLKPWGQLNAVSKSLIRRAQRESDNKDATQPQYNLFYRKHPQQLSKLPQVALTAKSKLSRQYIVDSRPLEPSEVFAKNEMQEKLRKVMLTTLNKSELSVMSKVFEMQFEGVPVPKQTRGQQYRIFNRAMLKLRNHPQVGQLFRDLKGIE